jgi:SHS2 domain-containing protein
MSASSPPWEHFDHEADIGVRGIGATRARAFENAALALTAVITEPSDVSLEHEVELLCESPDDEMLFVDWLNGLIYEMATRGMVFGHFQVEISGSHLRGCARGEKVQASKHLPAVEIKGATYTALHVGKDAGGHWVAQTVVDV